ncbi:SLAM family member 9-like isoform X1 [Nelusetta ayraudi]|uniref:SLAM family member 9-like isoform X1 n=1 Tax=Nelusetta ayraudi TaxID=303726 RepID=UPI003F72D01E
MVAGCFACFICACLLHLLVGLQDAEASACQPVIHREVGDAVEFSSCSSAEGISRARWMHGNTRITDVIADQFEGRLYFNPTDFSLTLSDLTVQDSGKFTFLSNDKQRGQQRETITVTLQVHEPITEKPVLTSISGLLANGSCSVHLRCSDPSHNKVTYSWTVGNETTDGSWLNFTMRPQDEETNFTCTTSNFVTSMSASKMISCSAVLRGDDHQSFLTILIARLAGFLLVITILITSILCVRRCKKAHPGAEATDMTLYADNAEITSAVSRTVYDQIQLSRLSDAPRSVYQEIP